MWKGVEPRAEIENSISPRGILFSSMIGSNPQTMSLQLTDYVEDTIQTSKLCIIYRHKTHANKSCLHVRQKALQKRKATGEICGKKNKIIKADFIQQKYIRLDVCMYF